MKAQNAYDIVSTRRNDTNTSNKTSFLPHGITTYTSVVFDPTSYDPMSFEWGSDFAVDTTGGTGMAGSTPASLTLSPTFYTNLNNSLALKQNAATAFSGVYNDLTGKPTLFNGAYSSLTGVPSTFAPSSHTHAQSDITGLSTSLAGKETAGAAATAQAFSIQRANHTGTQAISTVTGLQAELDAKFLIPAGSTTQYVRGDGTLAVFPSIPSGTVTSVGLSSSTLTITGSPVTTNGNLTANLPSVAAAGTYSGVTIDVYGRTTAGTTRSFSGSIIPTLNTAAVLDASRDVLVNYSVDVSCTALLLAGTAGSVVLEYADNAGMTTNLVTVSQTNNSAGGLVNLAVISSGNVSGVIPAGKYRRIRTVNTTGTPVFTARNSQEVKL